MGCVKSKPEEKQQEGSPPPRQEPEETRQREVTEPKPLPPKVRIALRYLFDSFKL